jgi:hypothetical protein
MARTHAVILSLFLGMAAGAGALAAVQTAHLGQSSSAAASASKTQTGALRARTKLLDRQQAELRRALAKRPPRLPKVPKFAPVAAPAAPQVPAPVSIPASATASAPRVRYVRPAPIVVVKHRPHGDDQGDDHEGGGDD